MGGGRFVLPAAVVLQETHTTAAANRAPPPQPPAGGRRGDKAQCSCGSEAAALHCPSTKLAFFDVTIEERNSAMSRRTDKPGKSARSPSPPPVKGRASAAAQAAAVASAPAAAPAAQSSRKQSSPTPSKELASLTFFYVMLAGCIVAIARCAMVRQAHASYSSAGCVRYHNCLILSQQSHAGEIQKRPICIPQPQVRRFLPSRAPLLPHRGRRTRLDRRERLSRSLRAKDFRVGFRRCVLDRETRPSIDRHQRSQSAIAPGGGKAP